MVTEEEEKKRSVALTTQRKYDTNLSDGPPNIWKNFEGH